MEEQQHVWSWGAGTHGQLATGGVNDELLPQLLTYFVDFPILSMSCGGAHVVAVSRNGEVATWGRGQSGQLGHGDYVNLPKPTIVNCFRCVKICSVSAGWAHTAFVTVEGHLYTCGDGGFGQLGLGNFDSVSLPAKVAHLALMHVSMAACGMRHTLALIKSGESSTVFAFGSSKRGQLGIELSGQKLGLSKRNMESARINLPQRITALDQCGIDFVHCNGDHSAAVSGNGDLYLWGRGFDGNPVISLPTKVFSGLKFCQVATGWNHGLAVTDQQKVLMWGNSWHAQLSSGQKSSSKVDHLKPLPVNKKDAFAISMLDSPQRDLHGNVDAVKGSTVGGIPGEDDCVATVLEKCSSGLAAVKVLEGMKVTWVAAGAEHSMVVLDDGVIMAWGWGEHGQLGLGTSNDQEIPCKIPISLAGKNHMFRIFCGSGFTFCVEN
eukprot:c25443_g1_i2 orf=363-1670(-)